MSTHRIFGTVQVGTTAVARTLSIVEANAWGASGLAAAVIATATSDAITGEWEAELDGAALVYVLAPPVPPYPPLVLGPYRPVPI